MSKRNGPNRILRPAKVAAPDPLGKLKVMIAMPFEMAGFRVRFRKYQAKNVDPTEPPVPMLAIALLDDYTKTQAQLAYPEARITLFPNIDEASKQIRFQLRDVLGQVHRSMFFDAKCWKRYRRMKGKPARKQKGRVKII